MKKIISLIAVVAMIFTFSAVTASAATIVDAIPSYSAKQVTTRTEWSFEDTVEPSGTITVVITHYATPTHDDATAKLEGVNTQAFGWDPTQLEFVSVDAPSPWICGEEYVEEYDGMQEYMFNRKMDIAPEDVVIGEENVFVPYTMTFKVLDSVAVGDQIQFYCAFGTIGMACKTDTVSYGYAYRDFEDEPFYGYTPITVVEPAVEEPAVAPAAARDEVRKGCDACGVAAGIRFISSIDTAAAGDGLLGYGIEITYNNVTKDVPAKNIFKTEGDVVYFTAVVTNAPEDATLFVAQPYAEYADGRVYATAAANA